MMMNVKFHFEELKIPIFGEGALFYGIATLESADEHDEEFYVSSITIGNTTMSRPSRINSANVFNETLFTLIVKQIEDDRTTHGKHAALEWSDAVAGNAEPASVFRRRPGMPLSYSTLSSTQALARAGR